MSFYETPMHAKPMANELQIGELARRTGVTTKTIRYYEQLGLLPRPARTNGGYRRYTETDVERLAFIRTAKDVGFRLGEIQQILTVRDRNEPPCPYVLELVTEKLADLRTRLHRLEALSHELAAVPRNAATPPATGGVRMGQYCPAITNHARARAHASATRSRSPS
jgi:MerR family transcriptional regulator, copper efflux regulator